MFEPVKLFQPSLTNTLAWCENSQIADKKSFISLSVVSVVVLAHHFTNMANGGNTIVTTIDQDHKFAG